MTTVGIRTKLILYTLVIAGLASSGVTYYAYDQQKKAVYRQLEERGKTLGENLSRTLADPIYMLQIDEVLYLLRSVRQDPEISAAYALDENGALLSDGTKRNLHRSVKLQSPYVQEALATQRSIIQRTAAAYVIVEPVRLPAGNTIGYAYIELSLAERSRALGAIFQRTIALSVLYLVSAAVLAYFVAYSFSTPILNLVKATQVVEKGNFEISIGSKRRDELGTLARGFNKMTAGLHERERERDIFGRAQACPVRPVV